MKQLIGKRRGTNDILGRITAVSQLLIINNDKLQNPVMFLHHTHKVISSKTKILTSKKKKKKSCMGQSASSQLIDAVKAKDIDLVTEILQSGKVDRNAIEDENTNKTALFYAAALSNNSVGVAPSSSTSTATKTDEEDKDQKGSNAEDETSDAKVDAPPMTKPSSKGLLGYKITKLLVEAGWDVNQVASGGGTPLHIAAAAGNTDTVRYLISKEANVFAVNSSGVAPIHSACFSTLQQYASSSANFADESIRLLLETGKKIRQQKQLEYDRDSSKKPKSFVPLPMTKLLTNTGESALHLACKSGNLNAAKLMMDAGADIECQIVDQQSGNLDAHVNGYASPLSLAIENGHVEIAKELLYSRNCKPLLPAGLLGYRSLRDYARKILFNKPKNEFSGQVIARARKDEMIRILPDQPLIVSDRYQGKTKTSRSFHALTKGKDIVVYDSKQPVEKVHAEEIAQLAVHTRDVLFLTYSNPINTKKKRGEDNNNNNNSRNKNEPATKNMLLLATAAADFSIHLWDGDTGVHENQLSGHKNTVWSIVFNKTNTRMYSAGADLTIKTWDLSAYFDEEDDEETSLSKINGNYSNAKSQSLMVSEMSEREALVVEDYYSGSEETSPSATRKRNQLQQQNSSNSSPRSVHGKNPNLAGNPYEKLMNADDASSPRQKTNVEIYLSPMKKKGSHQREEDDDDESKNNNKSNKIVAPPSPNTNNTNQQQQQLVTTNENNNNNNSNYDDPEHPSFAGSSGNIIRLLATSRGHEATIESITISPDDRFLISCSNDDKRIVLWDICTDPDGIPKKLRLLEGGHGSWVRAAQFHRILEQPPSQSHHDENNNNNKESFLMNNNNRSSITNSKIGKNTLFTASWDRSIRKWDAVRGVQKSEPLGGHTDSILSLSLSPDGSILASSSYDKTIRLWNVENWRELNPGSDPLRGHEGKVWCVAFNPIQSTGPLLASCSEDETVRFWNVGNDDDASSATSSDERLVRVHLKKPQNKDFAKADKDQDLMDKMKKNEESDVRFTQVLRLGSPVNFVAWSPNGSVLACALQNDLVRLFSIGVGEIFIPLTSCRAHFTKIDFGPKGRIVEFEDICGKKKAFDLIAIANEEKKKKTASSPSPVKKENDNTEEESSIRVEEIQ